MSLPNSPSIATFIGNNVAVDFPFTFKVWSPDQLQVLVIKPDAVSMPVPFTASLTSSGGSVRVLVEGKPLPAGWKLSIIRDMPFEQEVDLVSGTRFDPQVIEEALDIATAERQQLREKVGRAIVVPPGNEDPPELLAQQIFDARDQALTSAANAAMSEVNAEAAAAEAVAARDSVKETIETAGGAALEDIANARTDSLNAIGGARSEAVTAIADLADTRTSQFTTLADSKTTDLNTLAAEHIRNINTTGDTKLAELSALSGNMTTIANQAMADVVAEGDRQEARQQLAASSGVTAILLKGDEQENRLSLKGSEIILEATAQASRAETEADRAEDAANRAVDMTGVGLASKTNFGLARAGSGIDVDEAGVFSVKFPRVVSTPTCTFVADAGIGYNYTLSMSASTGAAEGFITQFRVFVDNQEEQIVSAVNNTASLTITVQGLDLQVGTIVVSAEDNYQNPSNDHVLTYIKHAVSIQAPRILQPAEGSTDVALSPALTLQALVVTGLPATPEATQILVATTEDFAAPLYDSGEIAYTVSHTVPKMLPDNSNLCMKARHKAQFYGWSAYGPITSLTTIAKTIVRPAVISPPNASAGQSLTPTIVATAMTSTGIVDVPVNTQVQVSTALDFAALAFDTGESAAYATSVNVPTLLAPLTAYYVRLRHKGNELGWSPWSLASSFTTLNAFVDKTVVTLLSAITGGVVQTPCPSLNIAAFANVGPVDTASNTQVQIATNATFAAPTFDTGTSHGYARTISSTLEGAVVGGVKYDRYLAPGTAYFLRARHRGTLFGWGNWSDTVSFTTLAAYVTAPAITAPAEGSTTTTLRPAFTFSAYTSLIPTDAPINTRLQVSTSPDFAVNLVDTGDAGVYTTAFTPGADLPLNTRLYARVRHKGSVWGWSAWSGVRGFTTVNAYVNAPVVTYPTNNATGVPLNPTLTISAFSNVGPVDTPNFSHFQLAKNPDFVSANVGSGEIPYTTSWAPTLELDTQYWLRCRHSGTKWGYSDYGPVVTFRSIAVSLDFPTVVSPADGSTVQSLRPTFTFSDPVVAGQTVVSMHCCINCVDNGDSIHCSGQLPYSKTYTPTIDLPRGTALHVYISYAGSITGVLDWRNRILINTPAAVVGDKWEITQSGTWTPPVANAWYGVLLWGGGGNALGNCGGGGGYCNAAIKQIAGPINVSIGGAGGSSSFGDISAAGGGSAFKPATYHMTIGGNGGSGGGNDSRGGGGAAGGNGATLFYDYDNAKYSCSQGSGGGVNGDNVLVSKGDGGIAAKVPMPYNNMLVKKIMAVGKIALGNGGKGGGGGGYQSSLSEGQLQGAGAGGGGTLKSGGRGIAVVTVMGMPGALNPTPIMPTVINKWMLTATGLWVPPVPNAWYAFLLIGGGGGGGGGSYYPRVIGTSSTGIGGGGGGSGRVKTLFTNNVGNSQFVIGSGGAGGRAGADDGSRIGEDGYNGGSTIGLTLIAEGGDRGGGGSKRDSNNAFNPDKPLNGTGGNGGSGGGNAAYYTDNGGAGGGGGGGDGNNGYIYESSDKMCGHGYDGGGSYGKQGTYAGGLGGAVTAETALFSLVEYASSIIKLYGITVLSGGNGGDGANGSGGGGGGGGLASGGNGGTHSKAPTLGGIGSGGGGAFGNADINGPGKKLLGGAAGGNGAVIILQLSHANEPKPFLP